MNEAMKRRTLQWASEDGQRATIGEDILIDTDFIFNFRAINRTIFSNANTDYNKLKDDIAINGVQNHVVLSVNFKTGFVSLVEGNHRISIAKQLNIPKIPVKVCINNKINNDDKIYSNGKFLKDIIPTILSALRFVSMYMSISLK